MTEEIILQNVGFDAQGNVQISYCQPSHDVKEIGVVHMHTIIVPVGGEYDDEIEAVREAVVHLTRDVLQDLPSMEARSDR